MHNNCQLTSGQWERYLERRQPPWSHLHRQTELQLLTDVPGDTIQEAVASERNQHGGGKASSEPGGLSLGGVLGKWLPQ